MIAAQDETYRDAKNIHSKYMRHQAFESEIAANKDRLHKLEQVWSAALPGRFCNATGLNE